MTTIIWKTLSQIGYDAFFGSGLFLAQEVLDQLRRDNIESDTGLKINNVREIAFDGADEVAERIKESILARYDHLNSLGFSPREVWQIRNEFVSVLRDHGASEYEIKKRILEYFMQKGAIPSFIDQPVGSGGIDDLISFLMGGSSTGNRIQKSARTCRRAAT